jgi:spermidine/putrescine transport system substrate-binding protein
MPAEFRNNPMIFPPPAALAKCEYSHYQGQAIQSAYEQAMTRVRAG